MLEIRLFGPGHAAHSGHTLGGFPHHQSYLLFCYLLLNRRYPQLRERIAALFWGDVPAATSRKSLRNALWRLRHSLQSIGVLPDEYLFVSDESVSIVSSGHLWLDVEAFESTAVALNNVPGRTLSPQQATQLENGISLYLGDLLEGVYADWCLQDRERFRLHYQGMLGGLMDYCQHRRQFEQGLDYGRKLLACDNTREQVHRQMMILHWFAGDRSSALGQYRLCCQILRDELGVLPMDATQQLYESMLSGNLPPTLPAAPTKSPPLANQAPVAPFWTEQILQRLREVQLTLEQTHAELRHLEYLIDPNHS